MQSYTLKGATNTANETGGSVTTNPATAAIISDVANPYYWGGRWQVYIPRGAVISRSFLSIAYWDGSTVEWDNVECTIYGHDFTAAGLSDSDSFADAAERQVSNRTKTVGVDWIEEDDADKGVYTYIKIERNLAPIIQQIVDGSNWSSGKHITLMFISNHTGTDWNMKFEALKADFPNDFNPPRLTIQYFMPGTSFYMRRRRRHK